MGFPEPEVGLVISYSYLWSHEAEAGRVEGRKDRSCAIVMAVQKTDGHAPVVAVVPITHMPHSNPEAAVEIPSTVNRHLGLDDQPSWIVLDDLNVFTWPGFDLRPVSGQPQKYHYGFLPPRIFGSLVQKFSELRRRGNLAQTSRDEKSSP